MQLFFGGTKNVQIFLTKSQGNKNTKEYDTVWLARLLTRYQKV